MKTKKTVIAVLAALLVISAALIVGCIEPQEIVSAGKPEVEDNYQIPEGKGVVRFKISDGNERTIQPDNTSSGLQVTAMYFDIKFTTTPGGVSSYYPKEGDGSAAPTTKVLHGTINNTAISLAPGSYIVLITAYKEAAGTTPIAGWTSLSPITITAGTANGAVTANLTGFTDGLKTGNFIPNITIPSASYTANLNIKGYGNATDTDIPLTTGTYTTSQSLSSGYYVVTISLSQTHYQTKQYIYALHVYPGMDSKMPALSGLPTSLTQNEFEVTFNIGSESLNNESVFDDPIFYGFGHLIDVADPDPTNSATGFGGWYTDPGFSSTYFWNKNSSRVKNDETLYANYVPTGTPGSNPFNITFTITDLAGTETLSADTTTLSRDDFDSGALGSSLVVSLSGTWDTVFWSIEGIEDSIVDGHRSGNQLVINNSQDFWPALAGGSFVVILRSAIKGGVNYTPDHPNNRITITVTD